MMVALLLGLPYELRERILSPCLQQKGTIELQHPIWADKTVFTQPISQVCRQLREEAVQNFYRVNVFVWIIDPDEDCRSDPSNYPVAQNESKNSGPEGPLVSPLPWLYPSTLRNLRYLRLNIYLPTFNDEKAWTTKFPTKLAAFVNAVDRGEKLKDLKMLLGTWYTPTKFSASQTAVFDVLEQMQVRGTVQVRTRNIYKEPKNCIRGLDLGNRMRDGGPMRSAQKDQAGGRYLDWDWEGGVAVT